MIRLKFRVQSLKSIAGSILWLFIVILISCNQNPPAEPIPQASESPKENPNANAKVEVIVFSNDTTRDSLLHGFGYNIYMNNAMYVHQPHIPAVAGNKGFETADAAKKTGELVAYKIRNNIMPPSVTVSELDSIGVLKKD